MGKKIPNIEILMDEIKEAAKASQGKRPMSYACGYEDGLNMALEILQGNVE